MSRAVFALDTSCMVAAVCSWHERHEAASAAIEARLDRGERMSVAAHALTETYAVLTRLPPPHRLSPDDAWALVEANFASPSTVVALTGREYLGLLGGLAGRDVGGGRSYDEVIAACAVKARAATLLTLNARHFGALPPTVTVVEPS